MLYICYDYGLDYLLGNFFGDEERFLVLRILEVPLGNIDRFVTESAEVCRGSTRGATCEQKRFVERSHNHNDD